MENVGVYRGCTIEQDDQLNVFVWYKSEGVRILEDNPKVIFAGAGCSFAECCDQIDEEYDKFSEE